MSPTDRSDAARGKPMGREEAAAPAASVPGKLSASVIRKLRQPFGAEHLRWKIQTRVNEAQADPQTVVVVYVDARSVAAHLDDAVPGQWHTEYRAPAVTVGLPALECRLTLCGVTRCDVGTVEPGAKPGSDTKDLYSDALKRAAVQFGVGAFLYRFPQVQARVEKSGQNWYITREAQAELRVRGYAPGAVAEVSGAEGEVAQMVLTEEGPPPIGEERGRKMEELLTRSLHGSEWQIGPGQGGRGDSTTQDYATFVLGFPVASLADLTEAEARAVYRAVKLLQHAELEVSRAASD